MDLGNLSLNVARLMTFWTSNGPMNLGVNFWWTAKRSGQVDSCSINSAFLNLNIDGNYSNPNMASKFGSDITNNEELRIVMVGKTGIGKSSSGNTILGRECFESKFSPTSMTTDCSKGRGEVFGQQVAVIDTPGLFDTRFDKEKTKKDLSQCISYAAPGPHVFLVVIRLGRFTEEEKQTVQKIQEIFGQAADKYSMVLFTGGDELDTTIEKFLRESPDLQELVARCNGQYHVFNNKLKDEAQVCELLQKIRAIVQENGGSHYTNEMFQEAERAVEKEKQRILKQKEEQIRREQEKLEAKLQEKYEREMKEINARLQAEREREMKENKKEREEMMKKWKNLEKERDRERKETEAQKKKDREDHEKALANMKKRHEEELKKEKQKIQERHENDARQEAESMNPFLNFFLNVCEIVVGIFNTRFLMPTT
ncbi:GTPase IMAP family member 4-like [Scomber japonicus]|uniref:GTPase IMAP family member 4-like n=1 Tax=Scomber japonicus TaxID=13676 RepID=UPI0023058331|nr:GTPase IMAP family member 4-like [Scomber japonicus]